MAPAQDKTNNTLFSFIESIRAAEQGSSGAAAASTAATALLSNQDDLRIPYETFFYLRGDPGDVPGANARDKYLHVDAEHYAVEEDDADGDDAGTSHTFAQTVLAITHDEDAFSLQSVQQKDIRDFYYALGHVKIISQLASDAVLSDVTNPDHLDLYRRARRSIHALVQFCSEDKIEDDKHIVGRPNTLHQNILLDLDISEPLMKIVTLPFAGTNCSAWAEGWRGQLATDKLRPFNKLARDVYRLLSYLCRENVHVGLTLANSHLHDMINQCRLIGYLDDVSWDIADTLDEMFKDNSILLNRVTKQSIETYLSLIHEAHTVSAL